MLFISSLALYQTKFWSQSIKKNGRDDITLLTFDTESRNYCLDNSVKSLHFDPREFSLSKGQVKQKLKEYSVKRISKTLFHEKIYFGKRKTRKVLENFIKSLIFFEKIKIINQNSKFLQELGGFYPNISLFIFCKKNKLNHFFLEPSYFEKKLHIIKNDINCNFKKNISNTQNYGEFNKILKKIKSKKNIRIPIKDKHHFLSPLNKILNIKKFLRFLIKIFKKKILKYVFVFDQDIYIVKSELYNLFKSYNLKKYYYKLENLDEFIYYPMHVFNDFALTTRSIEYFDQYKLIDKFCKIYKNKQIVIKEHPARQGNLNLKKLKNLLESNSNLKIINPINNTFEILKKCICVITVNSKTGYEALISNIKVLCLGETFYKLSQNVSFIENIKELKLSSIDYPNNYNNDDFFYDLYKSSFDGELYFQDEKNFFDINQIYNIILNNEI